ncbi:hypothetical protein AB0919_23185 [Streptomyces sp. NPDC046994]|uniref:hypothetical protein n=1 Tax=Streptomyces sp. NPDC046994 TaxID=3155735 RepID=UPI003451D489
MLTPDAFRAAHGDSTTWSNTEIERYEDALEAASPAYQAAAASGRFVLGRHAAGGDVVVEVGTREDLTQHIEAGALAATIGGTSSSGKSSSAALLQQAQRIAG